MKHGRSFLLLMLGMIGIVGWLSMGMIADLRDWLGSDTWRVTPSTRLTIHPKTSRVTYTYEVDDYEYAGERTYFFVNAPYLDDRHLAWLYAHRGASTVTVYYDPDAPERAVLVREIGPALGINWMFVTVYTCLICLLPVAFLGGIWWWLQRQFFKK